MLKSIFLCVTLAGVTMGATTQIKPTCTKRRCTVSKSTAVRTFSQRNEAEPLEDVISIEMPQVVNGYVGEFIEIEGKTNGRVLNFLPMDRGFSLCPNRQRKLPTATWGAAWAPGEYRIAAYSAKGDEPSDAVVFTVKVALHSVGPNPVPTPPAPTPEPLVPTPPQPTPTPNPTPQPVPPAPVPTPTPTIPVGKYGLAQFTYDTIMAGIPVGKRGPCKAIGEVYAVVVAQIAAGTVKTLAEANAQIKSGNHSVISDSDKAPWVPVFKALDTKINSLGLKTLTDWQQGFKELGIGFAAVGGS